MHKISPVAEFLVGKLTNTLLDYISQETGIPMAEFRLLPEDHKKGLLNYYYKERFMASIPERVFKHGMIGVIDARYDKEVDFNQYQENRAENTEYLFQHPTPYPSQSSKV